MRNDLSARLDRALAAQTGRCGQALVVAGGEVSAIASGLERQGRTWTRVFGPYSAVIGRAGFAAPGEKREGDGKTPSGIFPLEEAFGYGERIASAMPYRRIEEGDVWVNDPASLDYNRWAKKGRTLALSFEEMRRKDGLYRIGVVIGYNRNPVKKGLGSAIFLHPWRGKGTATSGCVAMAEEDLLRILSWLEPSKEPKAILGVSGPRGVCPLSAGSDPARSE
ncbi:MAG: L,D-transpeptidase family protein [Syntrophorhabdales bacterium]